VSHHAAAQQKRRRHRQENERYNLAEKNDAYTLLVAREKRALLSTWGALSLSDGERHSYPESDLSHNIDAEPV